MKNKIKQIVSICLVTCMFLTCSFSTLAYSAEDPLVVFLDPGHDSTHTGGSSNGIVEHIINLKIAEACKKALEEYEFVKVYMSRVSDGCTFLGSTSNSADCLLLRTEFAKNSGADVYVSLHNNASVSKNAHGACVYKQTLDYNPSCAVKSDGVAQSILSQLLSVGLANGGVLTRYSEDGTKNPDGSSADYYSVLKHNKYNNIPAVIVEHAYMTNKNDADTYLKSSAQLELLGRKDAIGIANYFGLQKLNYAGCRLNGSMLPGNQSYRVTASDIIAATSVRFAVWSDVNGQDDLHWYSATKDANGNWVADIDLKNHASTGWFYIHAYVNQQFFAGQTGFVSNGPAIGSSEISIDPQTGKANLILQGVTADSGVAEVKVEVWNDEAPEGLKTFVLTQSGEGKYELSIDNMDVDGGYGKYIFHTYVTDNNGVMQFMDEKSVLFEKTESLPPDDTTREAGDVDGNGKVELEDAHTALQMALRILPVEESQFPFVDCDLDGKITLFDAQNILCKALKIQN